MKHPVKQVDVLVRGAGIVGQSLALSLARLGLQVGLRPDEPRAHAAPDVRAYAHNAASVALLKGLKVWTGESVFGLKLGKDRNRASRSKTLQGTASAGLSSLFFVGPTKRQSGFWVNEVDETFLYVRRFSWIEMV